MIEIWREDRGTTKNERQVQRWSMHVHDHLNAEQRINTIDKQCAFLKWNWFPSFKTPIKFSSDPIENWLRIDITYLYDNDSLHVL